MLDPRFAGAGAVPLASGYAPQGVAVHHHRHRHHRQRKSRQNGIGDSPLSRDESIHKVDHGHHHFQQNDGAQYGNGFGVPYGATGFGVGGPSAYYNQQQQQQQQQQSQQQPQPQYAAGGSYAYAQQSNGYGQQSAGYGQQSAGYGQQANAYAQQANAYGQQPNGYGQQPNGYGQYSAAPGGTMIKHHRRQHRHRYHGAEPVTHAGDQTQGIPEQLIGQRSSSVLGNEVPQVRSPIPSADDETRGEQVTHSRRRHNRHHSTDHAGFSQAHQSRISQGHTAAGPDGYGHINDDLIFIERGEHSPHRQEPPPGYEYKGKIEVQGVDKETRSRSHGQSSALSPAPLPIQMSQPCPPPSSTLSGCPPGWQQMILTAAPGGPCPPGATMYHAQVIGTGGGVAQPGLGGMSSLGAPTSSMGFGGVGPMGAAGSGGGLANLAASLPIPPQAQLVADYIVEAGSGDIGSSGGSFPSGFQGGYGGEQVEGSTSNRATIIEVWQKRAKSEARDKSESRSPSISRTPKSGSAFDFDRFRNDILGAIERMVQNGGAGAKIQWTGHDGGTQTQINPTAGFDDKKETEKRPTSSGNGEVRVIVQPIQPVFYMPRQGETGQGPAPAIQQSSSGAPNVVYIPRNVYVPVIKPVFVPRERVIVRPQVIHVARPVLVDRPVPVTQRPIIIDREKPVPVPLRGGGQESSNGKSDKEEYVYRDNVPVAYGGRCAEFAGGTNYGYTTTQEEQQYTTSGHEMAGTYQGETTSIPDQYQHSQSAAQLNIQQSHGGGGDDGGYHEAYSNLMRTSSASAVNPTPLSCSAPIEVLDATINNTWQRTDKSTLVRRYGRPAYDIVQKTDQVEQQMYQELRQRNGGDGLQRPGSSASYGSGSGIGAHPGYAATSGSYSSIPLGDFKNFNHEAVHHQGHGNIPVSINY